MDQPTIFDAAIENLTGYTLPVRFDQTVVPGLSPSVHCLNAGDFIPQALAEILLRKIGRTT